MYNAFLAQATNLRVFGKVSTQQLSNLIKGVKLQDEVSKFKKLNLSDRTQRLSVNRLIRIRFGEYVLPRTLAVGKYMKIK